MKNIQQFISVIGIVLSLGLVLFARGFISAQAGNGTGEDLGYITSLTLLSLLPLAFLLYLLYTVLNKPLLRNISYILAILWLVFVTYVLITG